ncbi:MAG: MBL fold metallo-hydrolase [Desulfobacter sp.]|nr:MAG: MBL fold metallo-hydrolase [Desulfobacter sp.]
MKTKLEISVLCEDQVVIGFKDRIFKGAHGLSLFIRAEQNILFDTGPSPIFFDNAALLNLDLNTLDWIALSHGHWDHTDGLACLPGRIKKTKLIAHPAVFTDRHKPTGEYNGIGLSREQIETSFDLVLSDRPRQLTPTVYFLGQIPRSNDFESRSTSFFKMENGKQRADFLEDDTALAVKTDQGCVVIAGCAHAGICNICECAKAVTSQDRIHMVLGGFHLLAPGDQLDQTLEYFKTHPVDRLLPMHCTGFDALCRFHRELGAEKIATGQTLRL